MQINTFLNSLADTDLYKITMGQLIWHKFGNKHTEYSLLNRPRNPLQIPVHFDQELSKLVQQMDKLSFSEETIQFLQTQFPFLDKKYLNWLKSYKLNPKQVDISQKDNQLIVSITGPWQETIFWEVPLLFLITQLSNVLTQKQPNPHWEEVLDETAQIFEENDIRFADFGTRRRFSLEFHKAVLKKLKKIAPNTFIGTSNVQLAQEFNLAPIGTFAHELVQGHAALSGYKKANETTLTNWFDEFGTKFATAVTDTFTTEVFLRSYLPFANKFRTFRHDSGDHKKYIDLIVAFLGKNELLAKNYSIVFSNELTPKKAVTIAAYCKEKGIKPIFGIGSYLTHTLAGYQAPDIAIKLVKLGEEEICKLSDEIAKTSGSDGAIQQAKKELNLS